MTGNEAGNGAIVVAQPGGAEVLQWHEDVAVAKPGKGEVLLRQTAIGVNYVDVYHRMGLYPLPLPTGIGLEGAGVVEEVGTDVGELRVGDRVAYAGGPLGAYAQRRVFPAERLVPLPSWIGDEQAAAAMLQGLTAQILLKQTFAVQPGQTILVHAAAGGMGLLLCQWAKHLGARVIGTVGSPEKAKLAAAHGCDTPVLYRETDIVAQVMELTDGAGVPVVYDGIGKDTFEASLACLSIRGVLALYGQASGPVAAFAPSLLQAKSLYLTRPGMSVYLAQRAAYMDAAMDLFEMIHSRALKVDARQRFALRDAAEAHRALESRRTSGKVILLP